MKSAFIRVLFGDHTMPGMGKRPDPWLKVGKDIVAALTRTHQIPAINYVYGTANASMLADLGLPVRLIDPRPVVYPPQPRGSRFRHKLEAWRVALEEYDEIVAIDWDLWLAWGAIPENFWEKIREKPSPLQCNIFLYTRPKAYWRVDDKRKSPSAGFIYLRNPDGARILDEIAKIWSMIGYNHTEEEAIAYWMDHCDGGWQGTRAWGDKYEPFCCKYPLRALDGVTDEDWKQFVFHYE